MSRFFANYVLFTCLPLALVACGESSVSVTPHTLKVSEQGVVDKGSGEKPAIAVPVPVELPNVFHSGRTHFQSHGVVIISADLDAAHGKGVTRVFNLTTGIDVVDAAIFQTSLATRVPLGVPEIRERFAYGENRLRMELLDAKSEAPAFSDTKITVSDFSLGSTSLTSGVVVPGQNANGQVGILTRAVQLKSGVVLSSGFVGTVFQ